MVKTIKRLQAVQIYFKNAYRVLILCLALAVLNIISVNEFMMCALTLFIVNIVLLIIKLKGTSKVIKQILKDLEEYEKDKTKEELEKLYRYEILTQEGVVKIIENLKIDYNKYIEILTKLDKQEANLFTEIVAEAFVLRMLGFTRKK